MRDRALWLEEWYPTCRAAPGTRRRSPYYYRKTRPPPGLHVARGWRARTCPTCKTAADEPRRTPSGREASRTHDPKQPRRRFGEDSLLTLADSIRERGVLQPVIIRPREPEGFELIAGERRWRASRIAGLQTIPRLVDDADDDAASLELR